MEFTPQIIFNVIITILVVNFLINKYLDYLNAKHFDDEIPDELIVVPSIQEAYDIIEMEEMERDLGF